MSMKRGRWADVVVLAITGGGLGCGPGAVEPHAGFAQIIDLGRLDGNSDVEVPFGINGRGDVVGMEGNGVSGRTWAWRYTNAAGMQAIPFDMGGASYGLAINSSGVIAGFANATGDWASGSSQGFMAAPDGSPVTVSEPDWVSGSVTAINDAGQVAGQVVTGNEARTSAFRMIGSSAELIGPPGGDDFVGAIANGIASSGDVVGDALTDRVSRTFSDGTTVTLESPIHEAFMFADSSRGAQNLNDDPAVVGSPWALLVSARATNGRQVTGWGIIGGRCHAYRLTLGAELVDLGTLSDTEHAGGDSCTGEGRLNHYAGAAINGRGEIVGTVITPTNLFAFYYGKSGRMRDLNAMIDPAFGYHLSTANGINDRGQIVGYFFVSGDSRAHAYRMTLVEE